MPDHSTASNLPPSGPWAGYYLYPNSNVKHRMRMTLTFTPNGKIEGLGSDDVAPFHIRGVFDGATNQATWIKAYVGMHHVDYCGLYDRRSICGDWTVARSSGGFWIWPESLSHGESETADVELEQLAELVIV
jgi:hypothetical protein